jgi:acetyl-CoA carboxylase carboxyltransferase component
MAVAARLWVDEIIDPMQTRTVIGEAIAAANHAPLEGDFKMGVVQV